MVALHFSGVLAVVATQEIGRRTATERIAILGYVEDGRNLVVMPNNGYVESPPASWLNLRAHPDASVDLPDGSRSVSARVADGEERSRLLARWLPPWRQVSVTMPRRCHARSRSSSWSHGPMASLAGTGPCAPSSMPCQHNRSTRGSVPAAGQEEKRGP